MATRQVWVPVADGPFTVNDERFGTIRASEQGKVITWIIPGSKDEDTEITMRLVESRVCRLRDAPAVAVPVITPEVLCVLQVAMANLRNDIAFGTITLSPDIHASMKDTWALLEQLAKGEVSDGN